MSAGSVVSVASVVTIRGGIMHELYLSEQRVKKKRYVFTLVVGLTVGNLDGTLVGLREGAAGMEQGTGTISRTNK